MRRQTIDERPANWEDVLSKTEQAEHYKREHASHNGMWRGRARALPTAREAQQVGPYPVGTGYSTNDYPIPCMLLPALHTRLLHRRKLVKRTERNKQAPLLLSHAEADANVVLSGVRVNIACPDLLSSAEFL